jgi:hypothetical protein
MPATNENNDGGGGKSSVYRTIELISWVATAIGIFLAFFQLTAATLDRRTDSALAYAENFSTGDLGDFRRLLTRSYLRHASRIEQFRSASATDEAIRAFVTATILAGDTERETQELRLAVLEVADMFDQIHICTESKSIWAMGSRCNREVISAYFCDYAISFDDLYRGYLQEVSKDFGGELGLGVRAIAEGEICSA